MPYWLNKVWLGVFVVASIVAVIFATDRAQNHGAIVGTTYPTGTIVSAISRSGGRAQYIIKLDDAPETIVVPDSQFMLLPAGTSVRLRRQEYQDGKVTIRIEPG